MIRIIVWVIYDIVENKKRNRVIKHCKDAGLYRVQKSVFLGDIEENDFDEIKLKIEDTVDHQKDSVYVFPMTHRNLDRAGLIGQAFDKELVADEVISMFF